MTSNFNRPRRFSRTATRLWMLLAAALLFVLLPILAFAQDRPTLPARIDKIVHSLYQTNTLLANGTDDERRTLTRKINEQIACEFAADGYVWKSADPGRPPSKDSFARQFNGRLYSWDWQDGTTRQPNTYPGKPADWDITGQNPIPVACINHLAKEIIVDTPPIIVPPLPPADDTLHSLYAEFQQFKLEVRGQWALATQREADAVAARAAIAESLEAHRLESRKTRNTVIAFLTNWKNLATIAGTAVATLQVAK